MGKGYMGKILWVDLDGGTMQEEVISDEVYEMLLSGSGLAARILYDRIPRGTDPLGPDNVLGFVSGLLTGTGALMTGRWMVTGKSPLTGGWGEANCGGNFSPAVKQCGYDGIFVRGISEKPVYLKIVDGNAELVDASHLWGKDAVEAEKKIIQESGRGNIRVAVIGQAGENLSLIAGVCNDGGRIAARSGLGAVMGSKRLKAIALSGRRKIEVDDKEGIKHLSKKYGNWVKQDEHKGRYLHSRIFNLMGRALRILPIGVGMPGDVVKLILKRYGTIVSNVVSAENGDSPVKNWKGAGYRDFPISTHSNMLNPQRIIDAEIKKYHCYSCPIGCGGICQTKDGEFPVKEVHKPEYETCCAFGALVLNNDLGAV
ncbi:MAG: aldehyde ferredoxin oxidoreductase, partial [Deltaproteobacteria bacterium]|nr:aldehyde ferredoxin oxidoreductase [Deltaproteobacteria bacterium]